MARSKRQLMAEQYQEIRTCAAGRQRIWTQRGLFGWDLDWVRSVHRAGTANRAADFCAVKRFVDDLADRAGAAAALGAAAKAAIDMTGGPACRSTCGASHLVVAQNIAGANDHRTPKSGYSLTGALR